MRPGSILAAILYLSAGPVFAGPTLVEDAAITWRADIDDFGAYSGLVVSADGTRFITVADKGRYAVGNLIREGGQITRIDLVADGPLLDPEGIPVRRYDVDAEGLTVGQDGRLYVSFEANHRVWAYADLAGPADPQPKHIQYDVLQNNSSLEAIFTGPDGSIRTIPERSGQLHRPFPIHRLADGKWGYAGVIPRSGPWLVTGADLGPDGRLYLLERDFQGFRGFATRIRSFAVTDDGVADQQVLLESRLGQYDNLEGISAWRDSDGRIRLTVISDDNRSLFQVTQIVEFILRE